MGTRRSKHNKGRKPLYKEHGSETVRHAEGDKPKRERIVSNVVHRPRAPIVWGEPAAKSRLEEQSQVQREIPAELVPTLQDAITAGQIIGASAHDLLLALYVEKKIDSTQLRAGRMWQHHMEAREIQPCISIDPGAPLTHQLWQKNGDLSNAQYRAVAKRRIAQVALGRRGVQFLDLVLQPDVGRKDAASACRMSVQKVQFLLEWLLTGLAVYYGYRTTYSEAFEEFAIACGKRQDFQVACADDVTPYTVDSFVRRMDDWDVAALKRVS